MPDTLKDAKLAWTRYCQAMDDNPDGIEAFLQYVTWSEHCENILYDSVTKEQQ